MPPTMQNADKVQLAKSRDLVGDAETKEVRMRALIAQELSHAAFPLLARLVSDSRLGPQLRNCEPAKRQVSMGLCFGSRASLSRHSSWPW